jgi:hypothetical protein
MNDKELKKLVDSEFENVMEECRFLEWIILVRNEFLRLNGQVLS